MWNYKLSNCGMQRKSSTKSVRFLLWVMKNCALCWELLSISYRVLMSVSNSGMQMSLFCHHLGKRESVKGMMWLGKIHKYELQNCSDLIVKLIFLWNNVGCFISVEFTHICKTERMQPLHLLKTIQSSWMNLLCQDILAIKRMRKILSKNMMVKYPVCFR